MQGKTDSILYGCESNDKEHKDPYKLDLTAPRLAWYKQKKRGKCTKMRCTGSMYNLLNGKD